MAAAIGAGAIPSHELAHTLSQVLGIPLVDLDAIDLQRVPRDLLEPKLSLQYQVIALGRRGNRLILGGADPTDQEVVERIKFATQLQSDWVIWSSS